MHQEYNAHYDAEQRCSPDWEIRFVHREPPVSGSILVILNLGIDHSVVT